MIKGWLNQGGELEEHKPMAFKGLERWDRAVACSPGTAEGWSCHLQGTFPSDTVKNGELRAMELPSLEVPYSGAGKMSTDNTDSAAQFTM